MTSTLSVEEEAIIKTVRDFVDKQVRPVVRELEHSNTYPDDLIEQMKEMGIYGLAIPEPYGFAQVSMPCYARVTEELARGWMSLAGAMGGHTVVAKLLLTFGTEEQKEKYLPRMATGEIRATMALTEPGGGSDLQAMRTSAIREGDEYVINGSKTWISNARKSDLVALLCKTDPKAEPAHTGVSILLVEKVPGFEVSKDLPKLGYKGVESCELNFTDAHVPADAVLGGVEGKGFAQMMKGLEVGRIQVAARATGVARAALRRRTELRARPRELRLTDLEAPGRRQHARHDGDQALRGPQPAVRRRRPRRHRATRRHGGRHGQALLLGDRDGDRTRCGSHPRRLRLLHRIRRRTVLPRRTADDRRRGHQRDPAERHRQAAREARRTRHLI